MNKKAVYVYIVNVIVTWLLIMGGMCLAGCLSSSQTVYPLLLVACLVPASLFMKFRLPLSWRRFGMGLAVLIIVGIILAIGRRLNIDDYLRPLIFIGLVERKVIVEPLNALVR